MNRNFDEKLKDKIIDLIETDFQPYNPENWNKLELMMKEKKGILFLNKSMYKIAAVIALFALGIIFTFYSITRESSLIEKSLTTTKQKVIDTKTSTIPETSTEETTEIYEKPNDQDSKRNINENTLKGDRIAQEFIVTQVNSHSEDRSVSLDKAEEIDMNKRKIFSKKTEFQLLVDQTIDKMKFLTNRTSFPLPKNYANNDEIVKFGFILSSTFGLHQEDNKIRMGIGGGVTASLPIYKNWNFLTGISLLNQKTNSFNQQQPFISSSEKNLKNVLVDIWSLDLPISLKYDFELLETNMFVVAGITSSTNLIKDTESSYVFNETVAVESNEEDENGNPILIFRMFNRTEKVNKSEKGPLLFQFAKWFNLSFGVEIPYRNNDYRIYLEPYIKYPFRSGSKNNIKSSNIGFNVGISF